MHPDFAQLTPAWFLRAFVYTGSIGDFRYRFAHEDKATLHAAVYTVFCYEQAADRMEQDFPWTEEGVEQLKAWLQERYDHFTAAHSLA